MKNHRNIYNQLFFLATLFCLTVGSTAFIAKDCLPGQPAPNFTLTDINGKKVSLSDFKGKVVYMDIWASWCAPCIAEINKSKNLKARFESNPDVVFLYVSIDEDAAKWKEMVAKKEIHGVHLLSSKGQEGDISKNFKVQGIPKFILIDKEGNIKDPSAKRPSDPELIEDITALLN
ncbi:MAG TPA: TlpA disulfide reductase family protein [Cytophagaceae bacterium]